MKPTPPGWPRLSSAIVYKNAGAAISWLCNAFGFSVQLRVDGPGGRVEHSQLIFDNALIMVSEEREKWGVRMASPLSAGGTVTQSILLFVDDVDAHCAQARSAGAEIVEEPADHDYGCDYWTDRSYGARDCEGHLWWFTQRIRG